MVPVDVVVFGTSSHLLSISLVLSCVVESWLIHLGSAWSSGELLVEINITIIRGTFSEDALNPYKPLRNIVLCVDPIRTICSTRIRIFWVLYKNFQAVVLRLNH